MVISNQFRPGFRYPALASVGNSYRSAIERFANVGRIFNTALESESDQTAAEKSCEEMEKLLKGIGMWLTLDGLKVSEDELPQLAEQCLVLPDYKSNPKVASLEDVGEILRSSYKR